MRRTLKKKYSKYKCNKPRVIAEAPNRKGRTMDCSLCGEPYTDNIDPEATEIICCHCLMGLGGLKDGEKKV